MYLKCLSNEAILPIALRHTLERQEWLAEGSELLRTFKSPHVCVVEHSARHRDRSSKLDESTPSYRPSRIHAGKKDPGEKSKSVRFTTSSLPPTSKVWFHDDADSTTSVDLLDERAEETKTVSTIKSLLQ